MDLHDLAEFGGGTIAPSEPHHPFEFEDRKRVSSLSLRSKSKTCWIHYNFKRKIWSLKTSSLFVSCGAKGLLLQLHERLKRQECSCGNAEGCQFLCESIAVGTVQTTIDICQ